jgi:hypothetical protein
LDISFGYSCGGEWMEHLILECQKTPSKLFIRTGSLNVCINTFHNVPRDEIKSKFTSSKLCILFKIQTKI